MNNPHTINITYIVSTLGRSGPTNQLFNLVARLNRNVFSPRIITLSKEPPTSRIEDFRGLNIPVETLNIGRVDTMLLGLSRLKRQLGQHSVELVHSQGLRADFLNSLLRLPATRIATQRNDPFFDYPMLYGRLIGSVMAHTHISIFRNVPTVITCSYSIESANHTRRLKATTIQNGIDSTKSYIASQDEKKQMRRLLKLPTDKILFVWAAPFIARKNPRAVIDAFNAIENNGKHHLCLLGDGPLLEEARALAREHNNINFSGMVDNVDEYLKAADCFISTSLSEGLPNSVIEALAWGLPAILSDIPAHREVFRFEQEAGSFFPINNLRILTELIQTFQADSSTRRLSRKIVLDHFDADSMASNYQALYSEVLFIP